MGKAGPIEAWIPMMLFAIVFGLSMDYEVFLLSRIKEEYDITGDNSTAVAHGLAHTARLITAAAAIMICIFGSFVLGDLRVLKMIGFGLAVAVLIDATDRPAGARARRRWSCSATATGGCRRGSDGCRTSTSRARRLSAQTHPNASQPA